MVDKRLKSVNLMEIDDITEKRLWKALEAIQDKLSGIELQLSEVVRLDERVHNHEKTLSRFGNMLDNHEGRIRDSELWQAKSGDRGSVERLITNVQTEVKEVRESVSGSVKSLESDIKELEKIISNSEGQKDVSKSVLKWSVGVLSSILLLIVAGAFKQ